MSDPNTPDEQNVPPASGPVPPAPDTPVPPAHEQPAPPPYNPPAPPAYGQQGYGEPPASGQFGPPVPPPPYGQPPAGPYVPAYGAPPVAKTPVLSILSLITGILGILTSFFYIGFLLGAAGVVLGFIARRKEPASKGLWLTGIITGFVGVAGTILFIIVIVIIVASVGIHHVGTTY
jgi:hypothetical protein